ncbi:MAG: lyase family protein [Bacteroidales bacterium]
MRTETDSLGTLEVPDDVLYGIHSARAAKNFPCDPPFSPEWYRAVGLVKQACYLTCKEFGKAIAEKYPDKQMPFSLVPDQVLDQLIQSACEVSEGKYIEHFIVSAISGGAGTSINMNVNEIIANSALLRMGHFPGNYSVIDPTESANVFQSTNDVIPTSLKVAVMQLLTRLEESINYLRQGVETIEARHRNHLRLGYTQMQEAVPSSYGILFSTYSEALSRDWWRVSKCFERIKVVNLGGSAIGTGVGAPRFFIMQVVSALQRITGLPVTRGENLSDATANLDAFVEVHAILKAHAVNLEKMVSDLRLLSSDVARSREISLPQQQVGSSIMPGKVNPVIPEFVVSIAHKVYSNDVLITSLSAQGCLDLNAYLPVIGDAIIQSLKLLEAADRTLRQNLIDGLEIDTVSASARVNNSPSVTTALSPYIGYHKATQLAKEMKRLGIDIFEANLHLKLMDETRLRFVMKPENLLKTGFTIDELFDKPGKE